MTERSPILAAVDGSPGSLAALARARALAVAGGVPLLVCTVLDPDVDEQTMEATNSRLADLAPEARTEVRTGAPFLELVRAGREAEVSLIVAGATGEHTTGPLALGVTIDRLARKADRPVLVVRTMPEAGTVPEAGYRKVMVGLDGSSDAAQASHLARRLAPQATITGVLASPPLGEEWLRTRRFGEEDVAAYRRRLEEQARARVAEIAENLPVDEHEAVVGRPEEVLMDRARRDGADLLAVGMRGVAPLASVLLGSVGHHLVREASCDVLVFRSRDLPYEEP